MKLVETQTIVKHESLRSCVNSIGSRMITVQSYQITSRYVQQAVYSMIYVDLQRKQQTKFMVSQTRLLQFSKQIEKELPQSLLPVLILNASDKRISFIQLYFRQLFQVCSLHQHHLFASLFQDEAKDIKTNVKGNVIWEKYSRALSKHIIRFRKELNTEEEQVIAKFKKLFDYVTKIRNYYRDLKNSIFQTDLKETGPQLKKSVESLNNTLWKSQSRLMDMEQVCMWVEVQLIYAEQFLIQRGSNQKLRPQVIKFLKTRFSNLKQLTLEHIRKIVG